MRKIDLDDLERKASSEIAARANAPKSLEGVPLITVETAIAAWDHSSANSPLVTLALIARIRELEDSLTVVTEQMVSNDEHWIRVSIARDVLAKWTVLP